MFIYWEFFVLDCVGIIDTRLVYYFLPRLFNETNIHY